MKFSASGAVRQPVLAGSWYPADKQILRQTVERYLAQAAQVALPGRVLALVCPHAGYTYSGATAAQAFAQVRSLPVKRVVLLGPLHRPIPGAGIGAFLTPSEHAFRTPLGDTVVDREFIRALGQRVELTPVSGDREHSLEIQLPLLQVALGDFRLVPILLAEHVADRGALARVELLAASLAALHEPGDLMVASTDLSHLHSHTEVQRIDRQLAEMVDAFDVDGLAQGLKAGDVQACGAAGLVTVLRAAQKLGARGARALSQATSGDTTGDKRPGVYTVGYLAAAAYA